MARSTSNPLASLDPAVLEALGALLAGQGTEQESTPAKGKGKQDKTTAKSVRPENRDALPTGKQFSRLFWKQDGKLTDFEVTFKVGRKSYALSTRDDLANCGLL